VNSIANEERKKAEMTTTVGAAASLAAAFGSELWTEESKGSYSLSSSTSFARPLMDMPLVQQRLKINGRRGAVRINGLAQLLHLPKSGSASKRMQPGAVFFSTIQGELICQADCVVRIMTLQTKFELAHVLGFCVSGLDHS
jgi:hypothetical protein